MTMIRNAFGFTKGIKRGGVGAIGRATTQGARDSGTKYVAFKDPFDTYWNNNLGGLMIRVSDVTKVRVPGFSYLDDERCNASTVDGLNEWLQRNY